VFVFPKVMAQMGTLLADDAIVVMKGRIDNRDDQLKMICMEVSRPELAVDGASELHIRVPVGVFTGDTVDQLKQRLKDNPGDEPVFLHVGDTVLRLSGEFNVNSRRGLAAELGSSWAPTPSAEVGRSPSADTVWAVHQVLRRHERRGRPVGWAPPCASRIL
jgi:DNA polymerase-3 subunit alpha